jgi:hypothetical protein
MPNQVQQMALPKRWPLVVTPANRDNTSYKDAKLVNCFIESGDKQGEFHVYKRPGLLYQSQPSGGAALGYGLFNWNNNIYSIFGSTIYKNGSVLATVDSTGGMYHFNVSLGGTPRLVYGNGIKAYTYDGTTNAEITDVDFPSPHCKGFAYLDETTYVFDNAAGIHGSALNDPTSWDPLNKIVAQIEPDLGVSLGKQLVYVVAFKQWSTELFFDAANATGSPLGAFQGGKIDYGCLHADSVQDLDGTLVWLSSNKEAAIQVVSMEQSKLQVISTKAVERLLKGLDYTTIYSLRLKIAGHKFYILTIKNSNLTLAYDFAEGAWAQWTDVNGNYLPYVASTYDSSKRILWQHESNGKIYYIDPLYYNDDGDLIISDIYTPNFDDGTSFRKTLDKMKFIGDQQTGSVLLARYSDDDYQTWSNFRTVNLWVKSPMLNNCGTFVRRAYHFRHQSNTPLRIDAVDLQIRIGTM